MPFPLVAAIPAIAAGIGAAGSLLDNASSNRTARRNTDRTIAANRAEAELAYQRSVQLWNMQNEYNSPQSQMERFKAAGLNPHLIYGQGSSGLAAQPPAYQPPNIQYKYEAPAYGSAISSILPTLMSVGSWMQDMRLSQANLDKTQVETQASIVSQERARQLIRFLEERNPQLLQEGKNKLSLFPYQQSIMNLSRDTAEQKLFELEQEFRYKYGDELFDQHGSAFTSKKAPIGGLRKLQMLQEVAKTDITESKRRLAQAQASWSEFDITNPQQIMMAVLQGVMGLAGSTLRLSTHRGARAVTPPKRERPRGLNPRRMEKQHPDNPYRVGFDSRGVPIQPGYKRKR